MPIVNISDKFEFEEKTPDITKTDKSEQEDYSKIRVGQSTGSKLSLATLAIPIGIGLGVLVAYILKKRK